MNNENRLHIWQPLEPFLKDFKNVAFIVLNQPITDQNEAKFIRLWNNARVKVCVDGGANRLYEWRFRRKQFNNNNEDDDREARIYIPDFICGDLDSIEEHTLSYYQSKRTICVRLNNQNFSDFTKTLKFTVNCLKNGIYDRQIFETNDKGSKYCLTENDLSKIDRIDIDAIFCFCDFGGRLDHGLSNLHSLYDNCVQELNTFIVSSECVTFLLRKGNNVIYVDDEHSRGKYCGVFPLGRPTRATTYGLKWNLNNQELNFATLVSSSNEFDEYGEQELKLADGLEFDKKRKHVFIRTVEPLIWTMSLI